jgi:hypothetical protein
VMKPLIIQFSGGRTSGFMTKFLFEHFPDREKHVLFENTGREDERTLEFVNECDRRWNLGVAWLEAVVHYGERKGTTHKVVTYETASRDGEPFEAVIKKYGVPNVVFKPCTRELKKNVAKSYIASLGLDDYETAVGIRADEAHRINRENARKEKLIYPLADIIRVDQRFVDEWWAKQDFRLDLPHYLGNCVMCFQKSLNKLVVIARERPEELEWCDRMERQYGGVGPQVGDRVFFRGHRSARDIKELAAAPTLFTSPEFEVETDCFCKST